jgi:hypothetical protein
VIAEWHPNLEADCHTHSVLAIQQKLGEARQMQIAYVPHPTLAGTVTRKAWHLGDRLHVTIGLEFGQFQLPEQTLIEYARSI